MSVLKTSLTSLVAFACVCFISSCTKSDVTTKSSAVNNAEVSHSTKGAASVLTLQPGPNDGQDAYVDKLQFVESGNVNYVPELTANSWTINGVPYRSASFIRFDALSQIASTATITSAKLYLYGLPSSLSTPQGNYGNNACDVFRLTGAWDESTIKFSNKPDFTTDGKSSFGVVTSQWNANVEVDVTSIVSYFVAHPSENFGFFIRLQKPGYPYKSVVFGSSEQDDANLRPKLEVTYN